MSSLFQLQRIAAAQERAWGATMPAQLRAIIGVLTPYVGRNIAEERGRNILQATQGDPRKVAEMAEEALVGSYATEGYDVPPGVALDVARAVREALR